MVSANEKCLHDWTGAFDGVAACEAEILCCTTSDCDAEEPCIAAVVALAESPCWVCAPTGKGAGVSAVPGAEMAVDAGVEAGSAAVAAAGADACGIAADGGGAIAGAGAITDATDGVDVTPDGDADTRSDSPGTAVVVSVSVPGAPTDTGSVAGGDAAMWMAKRVVSS